MSEIIVNMRINQTQNEELKIPAEVTSGELVTMLSAAFHDPSLSQRTIQVEPLGRILGSEEVLSEAGVGNGAQMTLL